MSRPRSVPRYRKHKQSGQAVVTLADTLGGRRDVLLGRHGTAASRTEYARVIAEWEASGRRLPQKAARQDATVNELAAAFWRHAEQHYRRPDGTQTNEVDEYRLALRPLRHLYGNCLVGDFGPLALKALRQLLIDGYTHPKYGPQRALARGVINQRIGRVVRAVKWGVAEEMVPETVYRALTTIPGLRRGRTGARETEPVRPVAEGVVNATLPHMLPEVADLARLQLLTGMRPGEAVVIRGIDIDRTRTVWLYRPGSDQGVAGQHKTAYRGHQRVVALGPRAQSILRPYLEVIAAEEYLFSPRRAVAAKHARMREARKSRVQPSQFNRKRKHPSRKPGACWTVRTYYRAIVRAVELANRARACDTCKKRRPAERCETCTAAALPHWHPHQLRHTKATQLRREFGLDAARVVLGHRSPSITEVYAELDVGKAVEVMEKLG